MRIAPPQPVNRAIYSLLRNRMLVPVVIASILVLGTSAIFGGRLAEAQQLRYIHTVNFSASNFILHAGHQLEVFSYVYNEEGKNNLVVAMQADWNAHGIFDTLYLVDENGIIEAIIPADPRYIGLDMSRRSYYRNTECKKGINYSTPTVSLSTNQPTVFMSHCTEDGKLIVGELNLKALQESITVKGNSSTLGDTLVVVTDQNGVLLAHPDLDLVAQQENISNWATFQQGIQETNTIIRYWRDGQFRIGSAGKIESTHWVVIAEVPATSVYAPYFFAMLTLVATLVLIFALTTRFFFHQMEVRLLTPLSKLSKSTDLIAAGNYSSFENLGNIPTTFAEIDRLMINFRYMTQAILFRETLLKENEEQYRRLVEQSPDAILVHVDGEIVFANQAAVKLYAATEENPLVPKPILSIVHSNSQAHARVRLQKLADPEYPDTLPLTEQKHVRLDQSTFDAEVITSAIFFNGELAAQTISRDITHRKEKEKQLNYQATHDYLTNLPNRFLFEDRLEQALAKAKRQNQYLAVMYLDLDNFKSINDAMGHNAGDIVLQQLSRTLQITLRETDTLARLGGDEFVILLENLRHEQDAMRVANLILKTCSKPLWIQEKEILLSSSMGVSVYPKDGENVQILLQAADAAMYRAKEGGKNQFMLYSSDMRTHSLERISITSRLHHALENNELFLHYQPQINIRTRTMTGLEVLLRWEQKELGRISPAHFIPFAEESGLIVPIGEWVLETALKQGREWQKISPRPLQIAVNLSELQLRQQNLVQMLEKLLQKTNFPPELLELELTENVVFHNINNAAQKLSQLKSLGVKLAIDDFGTGYSTLRHLAHFPFDRIKIDQKLASNISNNSKDAAIVAGIITISKNLGLEVIAEGVENQEQLDFYQQHACHTIQGWYFSRALPGSEIKKLLQDKTNWL